MKQANEQLVQFITKARAAGKSDAEIKSMLVESGWDQAVIAPAFMPTGDLVPPPPPAPRSSGREIFFYLLQFLTLGISAISLGAIVFNIINAAWPDAVVQSYGLSTTRTTSALASFIVAAPLFLLVSWHLLREVARGAASARSGIRRVLTYLALFLASATIIGDVIALVYNFLDGQANIRFLAKVLTILLIGAWVIWYYWYTVRREEHGGEVPVSWHRTHGVALVVVGLVVVTSAFLLTGSPLQQQKFVRDNQRTSDLQQLASQVQSYYDQESKLPTTMAEISTRFGQMPGDPSTGVPYEYKVGTKLAEYQLCASFETDSSQAAYPVARPYPVGALGLWQHPAGYYCFTQHLVKAQLPTKP